MLQIWNKAVLLSATIGAMATNMSAAAEPYRPPVKELEDYISEPLPPSFGIQHSDAEGPVLVDALGLTLYTWPARRLRNGPAGELPREPRCENVRQTETSGLLSPYPAGLILPDLESRPTCVEMWPPVYAEDQAQPVGKFSIVSRPDGRKQWAYGGYALYRSALDTKAGQVNGGSTRFVGYDSSAWRKPVVMTANVPPAFAVKTVATGRLITTRAGNSIYTWDGDRTGRSNCRDECLEDWPPVAAGEFALPQGEWGIIERTPGVKQWTFRGQPVYTRTLDRRPRSLEGSDIPGWHNAYAQRNPEPPAGFTAQNARIGQVLADKNGRTIYVYTCGDDALDQLSCDHPSTTQAYRLAVCGKGDPTRCNALWHYVSAPAGTVSRSVVWRAAWLDPQSGRFAAPDSPGAVYVWTYRDRPIYTFAKDSHPGDIEGDGWGEAFGYRNGLKAFWLRDDHLMNAE